MRLLVLGPLILVNLVGCAATVAPRISRDDATREVFTTERAFAKTMADRDFAAFQSFLADETVFFGGKEALRGKAAVAAKWKRFYDTPAAPFAWEPVQVEVLDSGTLALSTGPVRNAEGKTIATFNSIWRRDASGQWRIVFDKGSEVCNGK
ncbi:MAG: nuclear transport factor 2 family protein [Gammaproteobacteria bacterium]|nr:MAG: nuclear transport factor 2 family protein [Gammaproteobacteria bacterium]